MVTLNDAADELAKDVVSIATSAHFGDLREDMITNTAMKALLGDTSMPAPLRLALAAGVITRLGITIELLSDEISGAVSA